MTPLQAILDHAAGRVYVLTGRQPNGDVCTLFGVFDTEGQAETLRDHLIASASPLVFEITPIVRNTGIAATIWSR